MGLPFDPQRYGGILQDKCCGSKAAFHFLFVSAIASMKNACMSSPNKKCRQRRQHLSRDPAGIRTQDPILKRDVLYLLSY
jgi:hypothetical protein